MSGQFHKLKVSTVRDETKHVRTVCFDVPPNLKDTFAWRPGQHLTVRFMLGGKEERRCFSISSSPFDGSPLRITVKQTKNGVVSKHVNTGLKVGDEVDVLVPSGGFCFDPQERARRTCYFIAAGSGITPLYSMMKSLLVAESYSVAHLLYGNADESSIIFQGELDELSSAYEDRLNLCHILSSQSFWSSFSPWRSGRIDAESIKAFIAEHPPYAQDAQYYICGPGTMNQDVRAALMAIDVPADRIHSESFGGDSAPVGDEVSGVTAQAQITLGGDTRDIPVAQGQTLLQAMRDAGMDPPYSCQAGVCATCKAKLRKGRVHMRSRLALDDGEIEAGDILTCQSVPLTEDLEVRFPRQ
ncbi:MAG: 2Fe-2S iron-sulfur cluster-binding protein [Pseudomonadota bacterium]